MRQLRHLEAQLIFNRLEVVGVGAIFWRTLSIGAQGSVTASEGNYQTSKCFSQVMSLRPNPTCVALFHVFDCHVLVYLASARLRDAINTCLLP